MAPLRKKTQRSVSRETKERILRLMERFKSVRVLVVGDLIVDEFIWGTVERISPEAPVPVVRVERRSLRWGGAANVANNLRTLGARVLIAGVVGADREGRWLVRDLKRKGIPTDGVWEVRDRPSTLKTRIIAHSQQVVRIDRESRASLAEEIAERIREYLHARSHELDAVIVSDYGKGVVDAHLMDAVREISRRGTVVCVDPKAIPFSIYREVTAVTPNDREAMRAWGKEVRDESTFETMGKELLEMLRCEILLITRGEHGVSLFLNGGHHRHIPTWAKEVYDVTGAGDTLISAFTLSLAAKGNPEDAALLANLAAGIAVSKVGTATVNWRSLRRTLEELEVQDR
jgi:D-beta-D-heptose 7-phosphate kinase/D-beta-D-heptose 1-phosphate adenosyltransferase